MRLVVPVYSAGGKAVASRAPADTPKVKKSADAGETSGKEKTGKDKTADKSDATKAADAAKPGKGDLAKSDAGKSDAGKSDAGKPAPVTTDAPKTADAKKHGVDDSPTANIDPRAASAKDPVTSAEADASGSNPEFRWPARGRIIQGFKAGGNDGIDISVPAGTSVRAAENGVVVYSGDGLKGYGNLVLIKHPNGYVTAYANNGELDVKRGEQVKRGQIIAKSGDTGNVNAPQLHFELRKGSTPVDPTSYLAGL